MNIDLIFGRFLEGKARRKKLLSPNSMDVRPMMKVVKGALFGILQAHFVFLEGKARRKKLLSPNSMDVRPMMEVVKGALFGILQMDPWAVSDVLRPNLEWTGFLDNSFFLTCGEKYELEHQNRPLLPEVVLNTVHDKALGAIPPTASTSFSMSKGATRKHKGLVLNYVSKRRVPNGPDPIHNRKVTNTRQPPERI
ncbi:hypothetical protein L1987_65866 [Smallanthus sonchifolius]|uniref:Uncharacterized protein n=1 Tax=Smallanthus sonchifolius TaxID=185202 RepID=A0ACB9BVW5_9ASTR|nr:hypothetical protein L1987_65866 [Smallanthus sonchifolius]